MPWTRLDLSSDRHRADSRALVESLLAQAGRFHLQYDIGWISATIGWDKILVFAEGSGRPNDCRGCAVLFRQNRPLKFQLGEITVYRKPLVRWEMWAQPVVAGLDERAAEQREMLGAFLSSVRAEMKADEAINVQGVPTRSVFHDLLVNDPSARRDFLVLPLGKPFDHQFIELPETFEAYLKQMSKRSRKSVQYSQRKLRRDCDDAVTLSCFETADSIDRFLDDAIAVSKKTYQWTLLGLGLRNREALSKRLRYAAENGWLRSYLLYCRDAPVAFMLGYQFHGCFYYIDVGYDPDWADWSVGSVLQMEVLEDLYAKPNRPARFDFSTGYGPHKARFANAFQEETNLLLLPNTPSNRALVAAFRATDGVSNLAASTLQRLGLKQRLKRAIRRMSREQD